MTPALNNGVADALRSLSELLAEFNEAQLATSFQRLATRSETAQTAADRRCLADEALAYFRGMTSLNDLVIMNNARPDVAANRRLDARRQQVYELLTQQL